MIDFTSLWTLYKKHGNKMGYAVIGLLIFGAGFQFGKISSPFTGKQPIIFEDRQCSDCQSSGGSRGELQALQNEGNPKQEHSNDSDDSIVKKEDQNSNIAGSTITNIDPNPKENEAREFVGSVNSDLFHDPSCSSSKRIKDENQIWFSSIQDAESAGYSPSKCTRDLLGI